MERKGAEVAYEALHKKRPWHDGSFTRWASERSSGFPYHFDHGVTIGVADRDLAPWDKFTTDVNASPWPTEPDEDDPDEGAGQ